MASNTIKIPKGATLGGLAKEHNTSIDALMKANPSIKNPNLIYAGADLIIPDAAPIVPKVRENIVDPPEVAPNPDLDLSKNDVNNVSSANRYINRFNNESELNKPEDRAGKIRTLAKDIEAEFSNGKKAPERISLLDEYKKARKEAGLSDMEELINEYKKQEKELRAATRQRFTNAEGKPIAMGVIAGRKSEIQRQAEEDLDFISRQKSYVVDSYNSKLSAINKIMDLTAKDYEYAVKDYERDFSTRKQMYEMAESAYNADLAEQKVEYDIFKEQRMDARANGEILVNTAIKAGKSFEDMGEDTQLDLIKWGTQSGLGKDFFKDMFDISRDKEILTTIVSKDQSTASIIYKDGTTKKIRTGVYSPTASSKTKKDYNVLNSILNNKNLSEREKRVQALNAGFSNADINQLQQYEGDKIIEEVMSKVGVSNTASEILAKNFKEEFWSTDIDDWEDAYDTSIENTLAEIKKNHGYYQSSTTGEKQIFDDKELKELEAELKNKATKKAVESQGIFGGLFNVNSKLTKRTIDPLRRLGITK